MAIIKSTSARRTSTVKSAVSKSASSKTAASKSTASKSSGTLNSNGYRDNFDYSAAIAGTTDSAKRQQLLSERQNKIDSLGLGGKVASNDAVSTWNGTYRPYSVSSTTTGANRVSSLYDAAENARLSDLRPPAAALQGSWRAISHPSRTTTPPVCVRPTSMPDSPR